jgi:hypothetical protein
MPLRLQIVRETPACSSDIPVWPSLNSGKFSLLNQPGKHFIALQTARLPFRHFDHQPASTSFICEILLEIFGLHLVA